MHGQQPTPSFPLPQRKIFGAGFSLTDVARRTGIPLSTVSDVCRGKSRSASVQQKIASAVGVAARDLFGDLCNPSLSLRRRPDKGSAKTGAAA